MALVKSRGNIELGMAMILDMQEDGTYGDMDVEDEGAGRAAEDNPMDTIEQKGKMQVSGKGSASLSSGVESEASPPKATAQAPAPVATVPPEKLPSSGPSATTDAPATASTPLSPVAAFERSG